MDQDRPPFEQRSSFDSRSEESFDIAENNMSQTENKNGLSSLNRQQKFLISTMIFLFLFVVTFMIASLNDFLFVPIPVTNEAPETNNTTTESTARSEEDMRATDTDQDGLSDYDELYIWNTSPYLKDTDSDTLSDKEEVAMGSDPNCPVGQQCFGLTPINTGTVDGTISGTETVVPTATEIRALILTQGLLTSEELASLTDEQLLTLYTEVAANQNNNVATPEEPTLEAEYTPEKIRTLLLESGIPESDLQELSDEEIMALFREAIKTVQ